MWIVCTINFLVIIGLLIGLSSAHADLDNALEYIAADTCTKAMSLYMYYPVDTSAFTLTTED